MSATKKPATVPAETNASEKTFMQRNWLALVLFVMALVLGVAVGYFVSTSYGIGTALCCVLLALFVIDYHYNSTKAGRSKAKRHTLTLHKKAKKPATKPAPTGDGEEAEASVAELPVEDLTIKDEEFEAAAAALKKLGYEVVKVKPGEEVSEDDAEPQDVTDQTGTNVEIGLKVVMVLAVIVGLVAVIFTNERLLNATVEAFWGRKAPQQNVSGLKDVPAFGTDEMKKVKISDDNSKATFPRYTDGTLWIIELPGADPVYVEKTTQNKQLKIAETLDVMTVTGKNGFTLPDDARIFFQPNDGRKASEAKTIAQIKEAAKSK